MITDTFATLTRAVRNTLPRIATQMNVSIDEAVADSITETIMFAMDEFTAASIYFRQEQAATIMLTQLIGSHLRAYYFLQVGASLGLQLGYTHENDQQRILEFADSYNAAFEETLPDRTSELYTLPSVAEFVASIFANGVEYPHITSSDDGHTVTEWRRVWHVEREGLAPKIVFETHRTATEGPAVTRTAPNGTVVFEEYVEHDRTHRLDGPAVTVRTDAGVVIEEHYFCDGVQHRDDGPAKVITVAAIATTQETWMKHGRMSRSDAPAFIERTASGRVITEMWFTDDVFCRTDGPAGIWRAHSDNDTWNMEQFSVDGVNVRAFENGVEVPYA